MALGSTHFYMGINLQDIIIPKTRLDNNNNNDVSLNLINFLNIIHHKMSPRFAPNVIIF